MLLLIMLGLQAVMKVALSIDFIFGFESMLFLRNFDFFMQNLFRILSLNMLQGVLFVFVVVEIGESCFILLETLILTWLLIKISHLNSRFLF